MSRSKNMPEVHRRNPFTSFDELVRDMFAGKFLLDRLGDQVQSPLRIEEYVEDGARIIRAEAPGLNPDEDIVLDVSNGILYLKVTRNESEHEQEKSGYRTEFRYGTYERTIELPRGVTADDVKATYKDGILTVRVPVPATDNQTSKVAIERS